VAAALPHEIRLDRKVAAAPGTNHGSLRRGPGFWNGRRRKRSPHSLVPRKASRCSNSGGNSGDGLAAGCASRGAAQAFEESVEPRSSVCDTSGRRLCLAADAIDGKGVYYAARTLCQFLETSAKQQNVDVRWPKSPIGRTWRSAVCGTFPSRQLGAVDGIAEAELRQDVEHAIKDVERGQKNGVVIERSLYELARQKAMQYMPYLIHLNFLDASGLFRAYPELAGRGDAALAGRYFAHKRGSQHRCRSRLTPSFRRSSKSGSRTWPRKCGRGELLAFGATRRGPATGEHRRRQFGWRRARS